MSFGAFRHHLLFPKSKQKRRNKENETKRLSGRGKQAESKLNGDEKFQYHAQLKPREASRLIQREVTP